MTPRRAALNTLLKITEEGAFANLAVKEGLSGVQPNAVGRTTALVYTTVERLSFCDHIIANYAKGRLHSQIRGVLRLAVAELFFMDSPAHAVCSESVKLACEIGKGGLKGYVNGVLRSIIRDKEAGKLPELPDDPVERLAVQTGYPAFLIKEHIERFGASTAEALLTAGPAAPNVRAVYPTQINEVKAHLDSLGIECGAGLLPDSLTVNSLRGLTDDEFFAEGKMTVQSVGAMLSCRCVDPKPGMSLLDCCAAPGGKTAYLFDLMQRSGRVLAWDIHPHRVVLIGNTLARLGIDTLGQDDLFSGCKNGVITCVCDAAAFRHELAEMFDAVLCDVPCSGLGGGTKPDARYRRSEESIKELAELQYSILSVCSRYLKKGGRLVYSTCTVSKRENEGVVERFLNEHSDFVPADIGRYLPEALAERVNNGMATLLPIIDGVEGFFIAGMDKK